MTVKNILTRRPFILALTFAGFILVFCVVAVWIFLLFAYGVQVIGISGDRIQVRLSKEVARIYINKEAVERHPNWNGTEITGVENNSLMVRGMIDKYEVSLKIWMEEVGVFIRLEDLDGDLSAEICESHGLVSKFTRVVISWFSSKKIKKCDRARELMSPQHVYLFPPDIPVWGKIKEVCISEDETMKEIVIYCDISCNK